jgi:uncharacterized protein (DUF2461 family)
MQKISSSTVRNRYSQVKRELEKQGMTLPKLSRDLEEGKQAIPIFLVLVSQEWPKGSNL